MEKKDLFSISWKVDEATYRADPALSQSTLGRYEREGFNGLDKLFEPFSSPSLLFGSAVDTLVTGGEEEFNQRFTVLDINLTDSGIEIAKALAARYEFHGYGTFGQIPEAYVSAVAKETGFWKADKWDSKRYSEVLKTGNIQDYYWSLINSSKTVIDTATYNDALACADTLRSSPTTMHLFAADDPLSDIKRYYQLKFKAKFGDVTYRGMMDLTIVDYRNKVVYPYDLKTTGKNEWDFEKSVLEFGYEKQSRLYWRLLRVNMNADPYFKDFKLDNFRFVVINRRNLTPLIWEFPLTTAKGTLVDAKGNRYRDPFDLGKELKSYLDLRPRVPNGINLESPNTINCLRLEDGSNQEEKP